MALCGSKPRITLSKQNVGHIAVNLFFKQHLHVLFSVKPRIGCKLGPLEDVPLNSDGLKILPDAFYHRLQKLVFLWLSKCFSMHRPPDACYLRRLPHHSPGSLPGIFSSSCSRCRSSCSCGAYHSCLSSPGFL